MKAIFSLACQADCSLTPEGYHGNLSSNPYASPCPGTNKNTLPLKSTAHQKIYWQSNMAPSLLSKSQNRVMREKGNVNEEIKNSCDPTRIRVNKRNTTLWAKAHYYQLPSCTRWGTCNWWSSGILRGYLFIWLSARTDSCNFSDPKAFLETDGLLCTAWHYPPFPIKTGAETTQLRKPVNWQWLALSVSSCSKSARCYQCAILIKQG